MAEYRPSYFNKLHRQYNYDVIRLNLSDAAILEQMAEECTELAQALLKKSRKLRGENPTPLTMDDIQENIVEELTDVLLCTSILDILVDQDLYDAKLNRWVERLKESPSYKKINMS